MPPIQEISEAISVPNQTPSPLTHIPSFPRPVLVSSVSGSANVYDENDGYATKIPSTAEQCKEFIDMTKQNSIPNLLNNNNNSSTKNYNTKNYDDNDDDCWNLTSLDWLQDRNLLRKVITNPDSNRIGAFLSTSPTPSDDSKCNSCKFITPKSEYFSDPDGFEPLMPDAYHPTRHADCKPPYSFSCLIFMAIENSPEKRLPVKDIYAWIQNNFPFFSRAPSGWKNSVRHNLSLNKCFTKVEKDRGVGIGKGSYWCVDPTYKANLLHALRKTPYQPFHQMQMVSSNHASAPFGIPLSSQEINQKSGLKSLFPYISKKTQGKQAADSNEIDVANALVSLRKSGTHLNKLSNKQKVDQDEDDDIDEDDWVDEDVDDDEADYDDEETTTTEMVHMLKIKLGQQKVRKNFYCTPAASMDHQYGMSDDRVRDILTRFDCFDECCSLSSMSDDEDEEDGDRRHSDEYHTDENLNLLADIEIKQEIKEEPLSESEQLGIKDGNTSMQKSTSKVIRERLSKVYQGKKAGSLSGVIKPTRVTIKANNVVKGKRKHCNIIGDDHKNGPPNKKASQDFDEEEQRIREGADALLELATNMIAGRSSANAGDLNTTNISRLVTENVKTVSCQPETNKKSGKRGRPLAKKYPKQKASSNANKGDLVNEFNAKFKRGDNKKRLPKDFVPNGLTSLSSVPRSFQSKRLQMRYLEQIVTSNETATLEQAKARKMPQSQDRSSGKQTCSNSMPDKSTPVDPNADDLEELDSKDWTINFSSIDLSEVNASDLTRDEMLFDVDGKKMVKEEPMEEIKVKEEVVDGYEDFMP